MSTIDLQKVTSDDVVHLYRGWRKTENILKDKNDEIIELREKLEQLQTQNSKFRGQLQAVQSIKEITINLQNENSLLQRHNEMIKIENETIMKENHFLKEKIISVTNQYEEKVSNLINHNTQSLQLENVSLRAKYDELEQIRQEMKKEIEQCMKDENDTRLDADKKIKINLEIVNLLRDENSSLKNKEILHQRDISYASQQLAHLSGEVYAMKNSINRAALVEAENDALKSDMTRLIELMLNYPAATSFIERWEENEGLHYIGDDSMNEKEITFAEFQQLKQTYIDTANSTTQNKISSTFHEDFDDENFSWAPRYITSEAIKYFVSHVPHVPKSILLSFLKKMNILWIKRERYKIKKVYAEYETEIKDLKRRLSMAKPYADIMAQKQIRKLSKIIKQERQQLLGISSDGGVLKNKMNSNFNNASIKLQRHNNSTLLSKDDIGNILENLEEDEYIPKTGRICEVEKHKAFLINGKKENKSQTMGNISAKKLLESFEENTLFDEGNNNFNFFGKIKSPTVDFLQGAAWLGQNILLMKEDEHDAIDLMRTNYLNESSQIMNDDKNNLANALNRLSLAASSTISESLALAAKNKTKLRNIVEHLLQLRPGNVQMFEIFCANLALKKKHLNKNLSFTMSLTPYSSPSK